VEFTKERGKDRKPNMEVNLEEFIAIKGINALGNQLTKDKINQISLLEPLSYEPPKQVPADELEVVDEETLSSASDENKIASSQASTKKKDDNNNGGSEGQGRLF
jgi:topoisomerase-4 subunit A